jgi:adenylate kinase
MELISFIGPPGSGKTTQAGLLQGFGFKHINTGELLRTIVLSGTGISEEIRIRLGQGQFVPPNITAKLVSEEITQSARTHSTILLDGSPRTIREFDILQGGFLFAAIFDLDASDEVCSNRLLIRNRFDDNEKIIAERLSLFRIETIDLLKHIETRLPLIPLVRLDATEPVQTIHFKLIQALGELRLWDNQSS